MGRKKIPPPEQTFHLGDRVRINNNSWGEDTGIIKHVTLTGQGSYQEWVYFVTTHQKYVSRYSSCKMVRMSIRCYKNHLTLLKRQKNYWTKEEVSVVLAQVLPFRK